MKFLSKGKLEQGELIARIVSHGKEYYRVKMADGKTRHFRTKFLVVEEPEERKHWTVRRVKKLANKVMRDNREAARLVMKEEPDCTVFEIYDIKGKIIFNQRGRR